MPFDEITHIKVGEQIALFPRYRDRATWKNADKALRQYFLRKGKACAREIAAWRPIPPELYAEYAANGNRSHFENVYFARRFAIVDVVLCECLEGEGNYLPAIERGLSFLCAENSWCLPAHNPRIADDPFAPEASNTVDLFAADTAALVAIAVWILADALSPECARTARKEIDTRVVRPFLQRDDYPWMGNDPAYPLNNWSGWIGANMLAVFAFACSDEVRRLAGMQKTAGIVQKLYDALPDDGEGTEGVAYWNVSQAAIFNAIELLCAATGGKGANNEKLKAMAGFPYALHAGDGAYAAFGDCALRPDLDYATMYRFAKFVGSDEAAAFAAERFAAHPFAYDYDREGRSTELLMFRATKALFTKISTKRKSAVQNKAESTTHYRTGQIFAARSHGRLLVAKGGSAARSHAHCDMGGFVLYKDGLPVAVDAGNERYTAQSFSSARGSLWYVRSKFHNVPEINGCEQIASGYAQETAVSEHAFSLDLTHAYPAGAVRRYTRAFAVDGDGCTVCDEFAFASPGNAVLFTIVCAAAPRLDGEKVTVNGCELSFDCPVPHTATVQELPVTDAQLRRAWGNKLYRLCFCVEHAPAAFCAKLRLV